MTVLVLLQSGSGKASSIYYLLQSAFTGFGGASLHKNEIELHSWRALVLQKQASTPPVIATWAIKKKKILRKKNYTESKLKKYWYLKRECVLPTVGKIRICQMLDFPRQSELHSLFQIFHKYKATLTEIKPPLQENSNTSSKISSDLTSKQILPNLKGLPRQKGIKQHTPRMPTGRKYKKVFSALSSSNILDNCYKGKKKVYFSYCFYLTTKKFVQYSSLQLTNANKNCYLISSYKKCQFSHLN